MRLYHARWVLPIASGPIEHGTVAVRDGIIVYVGPRAGAPAGVARDLGDAVLLPGLINAHTHLEVTVMRGFLEELDFVPWIRTLTAARREVLADRETLLDSARLGIAEGLLAGITTYADTCDSGVAFDAMLEAGVRGIMYQEVFGPDPRQRETSLAALRAKIERMRPRQTPLVRLGVSPHAPYTVHEDLLVDVCAYALAERLPIAMHLAESEAEIAFLREASGPFADGLRARGIEVVRRAHSPVHLLKELGVADVARPLLIHCVQLDESDVAFIAESGCPVAHCPVSNAKLGHGTAPLLELLAAGVVVGLGTDSVASNNRMNLLDEARLASLFQRARARDPHALPAAEALALATVGGARALGIADAVGTLEVGKAADLAAFPLDTLSAVPVFDPVDALVHAGPAPRATLVAVAGRELVRGGRLVHDDPGLVARIGAIGERLVRWRDERSQAPANPVGTPGSVGRAHERMVEGTPGSSRVALG